MKALEAAIEVAAALPAAWQSFAGKYDYAECDKCGRRIRGHHVTHSATNADGARYYATFHTTCARVSK